MAKKPIVVLGIDLSKNSWSVAGLDMNGAVVLRRRMTRETLVAFASKLPPASWHGSVLWRALPGSDVRLAGTHGQTNVA